MVALIYRLIWHCDPPQALQYLNHIILQEVKLRATQYLPDIIQLQQILYKQYNYTVDEEEASKMTVLDLKNGK